MFRLFPDTILAISLALGDQLNVVRRFISPVGQGIKKVPFNFTIKLPKPRKEWVIVACDNRGRIKHSAPTQHSVFYGGTNSN